MNDILITENFLLETEEAKQLYADYARSAPIIDYHCHLPPKEIADNYQYRNLTEIWLGGDHYKWRALRTNGVDERFVTGDAPDFERFMKWAETVPALLRNPLYHWTHLELKAYFGISDRLLNPATAQGIWNECNEQLAQDDCRCRRLMERSNVLLVCTTDDPVDSLEYHQAIAADASFSIQVLPTWRPDKALAVENLETYNAWLDTLASRSGIEVKDYDSFMEAMEKRHAFFHDAGCRISDHGLDTMYAESYTRDEIKRIFMKARSKQTLDVTETAKLKSALLYEFGLMDHGRGWAQQFHLSALRNNNTRMFKQLGPDAGFDSIGDAPLGQALSRFLDRLDSTDQLGRTVLYNLNPRDNMLLATMIGNFQDGRTPGKMQFGSGWWFLDQLDGMERQINDLSLCGLLSRFVGMLTDSRSFLSYPRHEYFRRLLCNILGRDMARGLLPRDFQLVGEMVTDICCRNAAKYFNFTLDHPMLR